MRLASFAKQRKQIFFKGGSSVSNNVDLETISGMPSFMVDRDTRIHDICFHAMGSFNLTLILRVNGSPVFSQNITETYQVIELEETIETEKFDNISIRLESSGSLGSNMTQSCEVRLICA